MTRTSPRLTFTAICEYLDATPTRQMSILRDSKYPQSALYRSYSNAKKQVRRLAIEGQPIDLLAPDLDDHEREVLKLLLDNRWSVPAPMALNPYTRQPAMTVEGVDISALPDLYLAEDGVSRRRSGALKLYMPKRELSANAGKWMASLLYTYLRDTLGDESADPGLCLVYDVRADEYHSATSSYKRLFTNIENACRMIRAVWPTL